MRDGTMFTGIMKYESKSFWKKNPKFMFSDLTEEYSYEVLAAFYDRVYLETDDVFKFYQFIDADNKEDFDYAISQFKEKSLYDTGVDAQYGDKLVTLNFPCYGRLCELFVGLDEGATLNEAPEYKYVRPVVYYGSSITQGGCASRPGMSYEAIISRNFNYDYINLGFSGNAKAEDEMIEYIK